MKKIVALSATALAVLTAGTAVATPSLARDYRGYGYYDDACRTKQTNNGTAGAVIGGVAGAVLGSNVAGRGDRTEGAVIGGLAGALLGNSVGRSNAKSSTACDARDYGRVRYNPSAPYYGNPYDRGHGYRDYRSSGYRY
ncbi:glycine zipper 2TM domain-containing protein [Phenylobacterium sp. LjRoot219]|uniref:glycine zipper 2TM domain-containing protein n=1 Tax=Phenylobacterium sp. LjRoot219 TaxID=3342283 RepID=UPI003ECDCE5B